MSTLFRKNKVRLLCPLAGVLAVHASVLSAQERPAAAQATASPSVAATVGQITGKVVDAAGRPVGKALVMINLRPARGAKFTPFSRIATTAADGSFVVRGVPAGTFEICPQATGSDLLPTCIWEKAPSVTLQAGTSATAPTITMKQGVHLPIRIDDSTGKVAPQDKAGLPLMVDITGAGGLLPVPASVIAQDAKGHDRDVLIPYDTPVSIRIFSKAVALADSKGNAVDKAAGVTIPLTVPAGSTPAKLTFTVKGVNP